MTPEQLLNSAEELLLSLGKSAAHFVLRILCAALVLWIGMKLIKYVIKRFKKSKLFEKLDTGLAVFLASAGKIALYIVLFLTILSILGIETASFLALFTTGGVAISLAFQGAVTNLAGGVMILLFHPFRVDDYIETAEVAGTVKEINVLYTIIITPDNKRITVPNGSLTNTAITDYSTETTRRVDLVFSASYASDIDQVKALILENALAHEKVLRDPLPDARLKAQSPNALDFQLRAWCNPEDYWDVYFDLNEDIKKAFDEKGIEIPYQQLDVHMK